MNGLFALDRDVSTMTQIAPPYAPVAQMLGSGAVGYNVWNGDAALVDGSRTVYGWDGSQWGVTYWSLYDIYAIEPVRRPHSCSWGVGARRRRAGSHDSGGEGSPRAGRPSA